MVVKVYVSGSSGNKEVKKRQQRVSLILDSKNIEYELLDIAEPNMEEAKEYMQNNSKLLGGTISDPNPRHPLPPQLFNDEEYCGDYDAFDMANEVDEMEKFLKLSSSDSVPATTNGDISTEVEPKETSPEIQEAKAEETEEEETGAAEENAKEKSPSPSKEKSPSPAKEKSTSPAKEKSPEPEKEKSPEPGKQKSPEPEKEKSPSPKKEKSPSPAKDDGEGDNATDDQKAENESNDNATDDQKAVTDDVKQTDETEKSDDEE